LWLISNDTIDNAKGRALTGKSAATVKRYLGKLCDAGILQLKGTKRASIYTKVFQNDPY